MKVNNKLNERPEVWIRSKFDGKDFVQSNSLQILNFGILAYWHIGMMDGLKDLLFARVLNDFFTDQHSL